MKQININRQLLGIEDLLFGFGQVTQNRAGQSVNITKINAGNLPFDETQSLLQWAQNVNLAELGAMTTELQALYNSLDALNNLEDNLVALNILAQAINCLNNLCNNLTKLQNIDINMTKLQNIDTNMTKLQNIDTNMTKLSSIYSNMSMLQTVYDNMSSLNAINSQIIPHLSEILLVDDYAAQVSADKTTVANDKASVASMKLAVETIYDTFDDRFLGTKTSDPTLDNDGNPLLDGAMYFNTSVNALKVYDLGNALWVTIPQIYLSGLLDVTLTSITTGDILTWNGSKWINTRTPSFDSIKLNGGTGISGTATWNNTEYTYDIVLNPNVTLQVGQEDLVYCKNNTASVIANGRPVMAVGTNGNSGNILVDLHDGTKANARRIVGIATEDLTANGYGFVTRNGKVRGLNTTGSQYGEAWADGDILYVKATGNLTKVEPADTALKMPIAFVIHSHTNGTLYVRTTGIDENHDKDFINSLADIHSKTAKTTPVDADEMMIADSTTTFSLKKITWSSIKTTIKTYLDTYFIPKVAPPTTNALAKIQADGTIKNSGVIEDANGNIGFSGVTPSAWYPGIKALEVGNYSSLYQGQGGEQNLESNSYKSGASTWIYKASGVGASRYSNNFGQHQWFVALSGTAGNAITWTTAMILDANGNLSVGNSTLYRSMQSGQNPLSEGAVIFQLYQPLASNTYFYVVNGASQSGASTGMGIARHSTTLRSINAAGTINASGADYAEYEYSNDINLVKGQIVGFKEDGTLTDKYSESIRFAIKSTNPSIVGGDVWGTEEMVGIRPEQPVKTEEMSDEEFAKLEEQYEKDLADFENRLETERQKVDRIAYAGKVPVNVYDAKAGQYIISSNKDDSIIGIAVDNPTFEQYLKCVGRVNKILDDGRAEVAVIIH